ncbi:hypothetical protein OVY01_09240 [Robbsia sp. Bb-Pol-6]|uniref:Type III effector protein n=1 Tax=Robbsia betulipollinis TaxID=2981849 RepID=A0ABT3ZLR9_9BURK|nr:hypothetical protein [Robbsia betulipollinis]MCY0387417.1 hypothetical protein [Robbsia betulipollinis]
MPKILPNPPVASHPLATLSGEGNNRAASIAASVNPSPTRHRDGFPGLQPRASRDRSAPDVGAGPAQKLRAATGKMMQQKAERRTKAQENVRNLVDNIPRLVQAQRLEKAAYMDRTAALISTSAYQQPVAREGRVTRNAEGQLVCTDPTIEAVLRFVQAKYPAETRDVHVSPECSISFPLEAQILVKTALFEEGCKVKNLSLADGTNTEVNINLTTYSLRQAIKKGPGGFAQSATLDSVLPQAADPSASEAPLLPEHPFSFLKDIRYTVDSASSSLKALVERSLNDVDPVTLEFRGRLGAQAIHSVISQKRMSKELGIAVAASLAGSGAIAYAMDVWAWGSVVKVLAERFGPESSQAKCAEVILDSLTPLLAETLDSLVIKRLLGVFKNEPLLPESVEEFTDDLKGAALSGAIAAVGSVANNGVGSLKGWGWMPLNILTNQIAASTSGAMVPHEIAESHEQMTQGVIQQVKNGFFPQVELAGEAHATSREAGKALERQVKSDTTGALGVSRGDGLAINSMGIGSLLSLAAFLPIDSATRARKLDDSVKKIVTIVVNTPTEVLSLATGIFTANHLKMGRFMTTDAEKDRRMVELIASKAIARLNHPERSSIEITEKELQAIEHPSLALTFPAGKTIVGVMNGVVELMSRAWAATQQHPSNNERDTANPVHDMPGSFPAEA